MNVLKKEEIVGAARKLFTQYGYKKVTMDEIAKEAGVTKKTVYAYFKDKEELFRYFILEEMEKNRKAIEKIEKKGLPFLEQVHETIYTVFKRKRENHFLITITNEAENFKNPKILDAIKMMDAEVKKYIKEKLTYAMEHQYIRPCNVEILTFVIYKVYMAITFELDLEEKIDPKEVSNKIFGILKNGILVQK